MGSSGTNRREDRVTLDAGVKITIRAQLAGAGQIKAWFRIAGGCAYAQRADKHGVIVKSDGLLFLRRDDQGSSDNCSFRSSSRPQSSNDAVRSSGVPAARGDAEFYTASKPGLPQVPRALVSITIRRASVSSPRPGSQTEKPRNLVGDPLLPKPGYMSWRTCQSLKRRVSELVGRQCQHASTPSTAEGDSEDAIPSTSLNPCDAQGIVLFGFVVPHSGAGFTPVFPHAL